MCNRTIVKRVYKEHFNEILETIFKNMNFNNACKNVHVSIKKPDVKKAKNYFESISNDQTNLKITRTVIQSITS